MKNKDIVLNYESLIILRSHNELKFPAKIAYAISRNLRVLTPIYQDVIGTKRSMLEKYGVPNTEEQDLWNIKPEYIETFNKEMLELDNIDTEISIQYISFKDIESLNLSIEEMDALYFMVEE